MNWTPTDPETGNPFRFTGRRHDAETGLYYYRARYYSPVLGRFLQTDPIGIEDDVNLYAYVGNDPLNAIDPTGKNAVTKFIKQTIKHRGDIIEAAIDVGDTVVTVFAPASTPVDRLIAVVELVSPVSLSDIKDAKKVLEATKKVFGGRKGGIDTRAQNMAIGDQIRKNGGDTTDGFGNKEKRFVDEEGARYSDGSATDANGDPFEVQTVDVNAAGEMTQREVEAAIDIAEIGQRPVVCITKIGCE